MARIRSSGSANEGITGAIALEMTRFGDAEKALMLDVVCSDIP